MKTTVLIVDDDDEFVTFLGRTLKRGGFSVLTATDGCEVAAAIEKCRVDLLLLDLQMPGMNGWEVLRELRNGPLGLKPRRCNVAPKVVVVSGRDEDETERFARHLGAQAYLRKPVWGKEVLSIVREILAR